jgi:tetratricopeptide (TPR) repeat protein
MFEFGRELRRLLGGHDAPGVAQDGLTGGDSALLELIDVPMLAAEAKSADVAAGRISAKDPATRLLEAAIVWRELARRTGDPAAVRKAAAQAEAAAKAFEAQHRIQGLARAQVEQAQCAMLGAELFGDDGLNAAAETRLVHAAPANGLPLALIALSRAELCGRQALARGDLDATLKAADAFEAPLSALDAAGRRRTAFRLIAANDRAVRADLMAVCGVQLKDRALLECAGRDLRAVLDGLDPAFEPLTFARLKALHGQTLSNLGEMLGDAGLIADGVTALADALDVLQRDHSPLDWARVQAMLGQALQSLGEATDSERAYEQAITCYDRAGLALKASPALSLRAVVANGRAMSLARSAELSGDLAVLDAAETAFKGELVRLNADLDPVGWALAQTNLARIYEARSDITGRDDGGRARAVLALQSALDVFREQGLRSLSDMTLRALDRLEEPACPPVHRPH